MDTLSPSRIYNASRPHSLPAATTPSESSYFSTSAVRRSTDARVPSRSSHVSLHLTNNANAPDEPSTELQSSHSRSRGASCSEAAPSPVTAPQSQRGEPAELEDHIRDAQRKQVRAEYPPSFAGTETRRLPRRHLGYLQIITLIINALIGTGIFTTPGYVLYFTRNKEVALLLWFVGGVYTAFSAVVFLVYHRALPVNGGPLIWLDEALPIPKLFATVVFSICRILLESTASNCRFLAASILSLCYPDRPITDISSGEIRFVAAVCQTVVCLLLFYQPRPCFILSPLFAFFKVVLLLVMLGFGAWSHDDTTTSANDFHTTYEGYSGLNVMTAFIFIVYSYEGLINVVSISGDVINTQPTLEYSTLIAIPTVTILYMLVTFAYGFVLPFETMISPENIGNVALPFAQKVFRGIDAKSFINSAMAISAFSNLLYVTYTTAVVKQAIALQRFIPFWKFFQSQHPQNGSPGGGLFMHWIFTVIPLLAINPNARYHSLVMSLFSYWYQLVLVALTFGLFFVGGQIRRRDPRFELSFFWRDVRWRHGKRISLVLRLGKHRISIILIVFAFIFIGSTGALLVIYAFRRDPEDVPRYWCPVAVFAACIVGVLYWLVIWLLSLEVGSLKVGQSRHTLGWKMFGVRADILEAKQPFGKNEKETPLEMLEPMRNSIRDGTRRRIYYTFSPRNQYIYEAIADMCMWIVRNFGYIKANESRRGTRESQRHRLRETYDIGRTRNKRKGNFSNVSKYDDTIAANESHPFEHLTVSFKDQKLDGWRHCST